MYLMCMQILLAAQDISGFRDWEDNCMDAHSNGVRSQHEIGGLENMKWSYSI